MTRVKRTTDSNEFNLSQPAPVDLPTYGSIERVENEIVIAEGINPSDDYAQQLAFLEEPIEVTVHESTEDNAEPIVVVQCNGVPQRFIRGQPLTVKRKYVAILAGSKETRMKTEVHVDPGQEPVNRVIRHSALRFPFTVNYDPNPAGREWLRNLLSR